MCEYYNVCTAPLVNDLAVAIFEAFQDLAATIETPYGMVIPYDPFPKQNWTAINDFPVVAIQGFKVIQNELDKIITLRSKKNK